MGLDKRGRSSHNAGAMRHWLLPIVIVGIAAVLAFGGESAREWLRFDRSAIGDGDYWRLVSGHLVHLGWSHLALNAAGLVLVWFLVGSSLAPRDWAVVILLSIAAIDLGFWLLNPELGWYVGLSGLLHGMLAAGLAVSCRQPNVETVALAVILAAKLVFEQVSGPLPGSETSSGGPVIVDAHLYGAIGGICGAMAALIRVRAGAAI